MSYKIKFIYPEIKTGPIENDSTTCKSLLLKGELVIKNKLENIPALYKVQDLVCINQI